MKHSIIKDFSGWNRLVEAQAAPAPAPAGQPAPTTPAPAPAIVSAPVQGGPIGPQITSQDGALTNEDIKKVQAVVFNVPIEDASCDGLVGPLTKEKIKAFRAIRGIGNEQTEPTQTSIGPQTLTWINDSIEKRNAAAAAGTSGTAGAAAVPAGVWPDRKPEDDKLAEKICTEIVAKFADPAFWKPFKGGFNDDEAGATKAYTQWYTSTIDPQVKQLRPGDPNSERITKANQMIVLKLGGGQSLDEHTWSIETLQGEKQYKVDTDF